MDDQISMKHLQQQHERGLQLHGGLHDPNKHTLHQKRDVEDDGESCSDEEQQLYDSLDAAAAAENSRDTRFLPERLGTLMEKPLLTDDAYSDLRYDPNWRTNLRGAARFNDSPHVSLQDYYHVPKAPPRGGRLTAGYRYITDTSPVAVVTPHIIGKDHDQPFCLQPEDGKTSPETIQPNPSHSITKSDEDSPKKRENSSDAAGKNVCTTPEQDIQDVYVREFKPRDLREQRHTHGDSTELRQIRKSTSTEALVGKKLKRPTEDVVQRNKRTLGCNTFRCGSYLSVYSEKHRGNYKACATLKETDGPEDGPDSADTQELKVSEGTTAPGKVEAERGDSSAAVTRPNPQKKTSPSQPLHLHTSSHLLPLIQQRGRDEIINLASLYLHRSPPSLSPSCPLQTKPGMSSRASNTDLHDPNSERSQRTPALKWPFYRNTGDQKWLIGGKFPQSLPRTPSTTPSLSSGTFTVLPAIGASVSVGENGVYRSSSDSYVSQKEKEKQLRRRVPRQEYTLRDYKQLKTNTNVQCPDSTAVENAKMKRQKLYSNAIREQNKKISRIPFRPDEDRQDDGKKVPRTKALEYAKTITKPQPKPAPRNQSESFMAPWDVSNSLELLRKRHEEEKQVVANFRKVHAL